MRSPATYPNEGSGIKYQVYTTQSTQFEMSDPDQNKGKTSYKLEPNIEAPIQTLQDYEFQMQDSDDDLKELSDEEILEVGDEMEDA
ncbi:hypothetical protein Tco_0061901, partial [Tanacetum coccineum]